MGACRRGFVRSDEDEDGGGAIGDGAGAGAIGDGAGPSSSTPAVRKRRKRSISQAAFEPHSTAGKAKKYQRFKHAVELEDTDLDSDSGEEDYESEDITEAASRLKRFGIKHNKRVRKKDGKESSGPSLCATKRKQRFLSAQKTSSSKAAGIRYEEIAEESTQKQTDNAVQLPLGKEFEQYLLEEVFNTSRDTYTQEIDVPERFQIHEQSVIATVSKGDWTKEAHWIYDRAFGNSETISQEEDLKVIADIDKEEIVQEILFVLMQLHVQKCEIPVIGMYNFHGCMHLARRKESSDTGFYSEESKVEMKSFKALWWIFHWDRKWLLLQHRKNKLQETWEKHAVVKESESATNDGTLDMLIQALQDAESEPVIDDLDAKFNLQFPTDDVAQSKGQYKRPKRQSYYNMCCKAGLRQLVKQLGPTPEQLGENLHSMQKIHEARDCDVAPCDTDLSCASGQFAEVHRALEGARHMAAYELSCEPRVRSYVRSRFFEHALVSTRPTAKGEGLIDAFHEFACVKYVQAKPVKKFDDGEWLIIQRAEEEELLDVTIELTQETYGVVMQGLEESYFSNASSEVAVSWNEQRKLTLQEAVSKMILPLLVKGLRMSLSAKAKSWVQSKCSDNLWKRASVAPYLVADHLSSKATNDAEAARVLACCWGSRNPPTTFVMLDPCGELVDTLQTGYLTLYSGGIDQQLQRKTDDQERLQKFILLHQPDVVVVGATVNYACRHLKDTIAETVARAAEVNSGLSSVPVIYGDESLPSLYEKSQVSIVQLPKQPSIIRRAVALGRNLQNPLALIASLCNPSKDIVSLSLHPMQRFLSAEELYTAIEKVMITVTSQVGIDVNLAVKHEWLFSPLQFVCGLGWKKASMLQQVIQELRWLPSRGYLSRHPFSLKDVVFRNCSGFVRIRRVAHAVSGLRKLDLLDDTRIHPNSYELARNLAIYAFSKGQDSLDSETDMDMVERAIVQIRQNPDTLTDAIVIEFFNSLQETELVELETLKHIRAELLCGFRDYRAPYTQPTQEEEFNWLTGEDDASLASGKPVNVIVHKVFRHRIICILESGIRGILEKENFTSDSSVDLTKVFLEGNSLACCIATVLKDQFLVQLTCLESPSVDEPVQKLGQFHSRDYKFKPREVHHSLFQNVSASDAMKVLSDSDPGAVIFHPSSRGPTCLSMTIKCRDNIYLQKEIEELEKDSTDLVTFSRLGRSLKIGGRIFQTLEEVVTSYTSPLMSKMNEVQQLQEFQSCSDGEIRSYLHQKKEACSESLVYCFSISPKDFGAIALSYMVDGNIKQETVDLYPEGYGFLSKMFRKIDTLVNYLKKTALAPPSDATQGWGGQGGGDEQRGDGTERGRGGRFGTGRRGRGREGRGGRGNSSTGKWGGYNKEDGFNSFKDAQKEGGTSSTFSGGWGGKADWTQNQNDNEDNSWGRGGRGGFRGRRGRGRGHGRGEGGQWGQGDNKNGENFWSGGTGNKDDMDSLKASDTGAGNDGWGTGNDVWSSAGSHMDENSKQNEKDLSGWGDGSRNPTVEKGNGQGGWDSGDVKATINNNTECKSGGWIGEDGANVEDAKDFSTSNTGWDAPESTDIKASTENQWGELASADTPKKRGSQTERGWESGDGEWGGDEGMLGKSQTRDGCRSDDPSTQKQCSGRNDNQCNSGWGEPKGQIDSTWGGDTGSREKNQAVCGWGSETQSQTIVENDNSSKPGWHTSKSQADEGWGGCDSLLDKNQTGGGGGDDDVLMQKKEESSGGGWGNNDALSQKASDGGGWGVDDVWAEKQSICGSDAKSKPGWELSEMQNDSGWGGDEVVLNKSRTGGGWRNDDVSTHKPDSGGGWGCANVWTDEQTSGGSDTRNKLGWEPSKRQNNNGWRGDNSLSNKNQTGGGWGNDDVLPHKADSGGGWGCADAWTDKQTSGESDASNKLGWEASKRQNNSGWGGRDGSEEIWPEDANRPERGSFRGGRGWSRGQGRCGRGRWSQSEFDMERGGRGGWPRSQGDGAGRRGRGGRGRWSDNQANVADYTGRGGRGGWSQRSRSGDGWNRDYGVENLRKISAPDSNDWWASGGSQDTAQKEKGLENTWGSKGNSKDVAGEGWNEWASSSTKVETVGARDTDLDGWGDPLDNTMKMPKQTTAENPKDGVESGWDTWTQRTQESECTHDGSSKVNVASEERSGWGANDIGRKCSEDEDAGHVKARLSVNRGWDAQREGDLSHGPGMQTGTESAEDRCKDSIKSNYEGSEGKEPVTQMTALMEAELDSKEFSKESIEERGDGIWGACEDLIDSKEMEGLISQKRPFDNALEPHNTNDAMQGHETVEAVLRGLADADHGNRSDDLVSILEYTPSDKSSTHEGMKEFSAAAELIGPNKEAPKTD